jgi:hypothetical protein
MFKDLPGSGSAVVLNQLGSGDCSGVSDWVEVRAQYYVGYKRFMCCSAVVSDCEHTQQFLMHCSGRMGFKNWGLQRLPVLRVLQPCICCPVKSNTLSSK